MLFCLPPGCVPVSANRLRADDVNVMRPAIGAASVQRVCRADNESVPLGWTQLMRPIRSDRIASSAPGNNLSRWLRSFVVWVRAARIREVYLGRWFWGADLALRFLDIEMGGTSWLLLSRAVAIGHPDRGAAVP
jgi:hypothetical protein